MSEDLKLSDAVIDLLDGIAALGNPQTHAIYNALGQPKYRPIKSGVSRAAIVRHLNGERPIGGYFVLSDSTRVAVIDFDDHDGDMSWDEMEAAALPIIRELHSRGLKTLCCRSGGGAGLHVWMFWEEPQSAKLVQQFIRAVIESCGFKHGTKGGVREKVVEVFPKNVKVAEGKLGNLVAFPFARKSVPLNAALHPVPWGDYQPLKIDELYSPNVESLYDPPAPKGPKKSVQTRQLPKTAPMDNGSSADEKEVQAALNFIDSDDYETWTKVAFALKHNLGEQGFELWDRWASSSTKYDGADESRKIWDSIEPDGTLTIGTVFHLAKDGGWEGKTHPVIREYNAKYGLLTYAATTRIILKNSTSYEVLSWLSKQAFIDRNKSERFSVVDENGNVRQRSKTDFWLQSADTQHYHEVIFDPSLPSGHNGERWNTWRGFAVEPEPGDWSGMQEHIHQNICSGDNERFEWTLNWMALGVQQPAHVIGTAPALIGLPGTGKGVWANAYGALWFPHFVTITKDDHVRGRFNHHMLGRRLVYVDEAMFGGDRRNAGVIKTMITEPYIMIEQKGVDPIMMKNRMIFIVTSNERSVVPADVGDRRWQVFYVSDQRRDDKAYFAAIMQQMQNGGYQAMLYDLVERDISKGPDPRKTIKTPELFDQIIQAQGPIEKYLYHVLDLGQLPQPDAPGNGPGITTIAAMHSELVRKFPKSDYVQETIFGRELSRVFGKMRKVLSGSFIAGHLRSGDPILDRSTRYYFPSLSICRRRFEDFIGQTIPWSNDTSEWLGDADPPKDYGDFDPGGAPPF